MLKNVVACGVASLMMCLSSVSAFAVYGEETQAENFATPAYEELNYTDSYRKILLSKEPVLENGNQVAVINSYIYIPMKPMLLTADYMQSVYEDEYLPSNGGYARLTGYFMYDYKTVSCYDTSVTHDLTDFKQKSLNISGNGTSRSRAKLSFSFTSYLGTSNQTLSVSCTKDGKN